MSNSKTHIITAFIISIIISIFLFKYYNALFINLSFFHYLFLILVVYLYSLFSDIDHKNSKITWHFIGLSIVFIVLGFIVYMIKIDLNNFLLNNILFLGIILLIFTFTFVLFFNHRGFTHSILFVIISTLPMLYINNISFILAIIAMISHLILDKEFKFI